MTDNREFSSPESITSAYGMHAIEHDSAGREQWHQEDRAFVDRFAALLPKAGSILDVGAGAGNQSAYFAEQGLSVTMMDGTREMLDLAKSHVPSAEAVVAVLPDLPVPDNSFDGIFCRHVLHHLDPPDVEQSIRRMKRAVKMMGVIGLVLSVSPDPTPRQGWYNIQGGDHIRQYFHSPAELRDIFDRLGLVTIEYTVGVIQTTEKTSGMPILRTVLQKVE